MSKKILITGGLGFIGIHCIEKWYDSGWDITVIDNLSSNVIDPSHDIASKATVISANILDVEWKDLPVFDMILNLASPVGPVAVLKQSGIMGRLIIDDIYWVIEGSKRNKCPLIFVSTSEVYGYTGKKIHLVEEDNKVLHGEFIVRHEYSISKLLAEIILANQAKVDDTFKYQTIRPFNVSGGYQLPDGGFVLPRFVQQALEGKDITVYYSGEQLRAFTWVKDVVEGIFLISIADNENWNQEWNIGNEENEQSILYLAEKTKEFTNSNSNIIHVDPTTLHGPLFAEAPEKVPNSTKIQSKLGWNPTKSVDDVIKEVIEFWRDKV